jgi:stage III sporulation protein AH
MMFRKKHIVMLLLIALIAVSVYLNTSYAKSGGDYLLTDTSDSAETVKNLGEAALVSGGNGTVDTIDAASYFAQAKIVREQTRDEAVDLLQSVADNAAADADTET